MSLIARRVFVVLAVTSAALGPAVLSANPTYIDIDPDSYAAVAYSPSTGAYYYAYGYGSRASASADRTSPVRTGRSAKSPGLKW